MNEDELLREALEGILQVEQPDDPELWSQLEDHGFSRIGVPERAGGSGGSTSSMFLTLASVAASGALVPVTESVVAGLLCARAGLVLPQGAATFAPANRTDRFVVTDTDAGPVVTARLQRVPWAATASTLVLADQEQTVIVDRSAFAVRTRGSNIAGEPRDTVVVDGPALARSTSAGAGSLLVGSAARSAAMVGALRRAVSLTRDHIADRVQFGRPLSANQLVRDRVAGMVAEVAAAESAARIALSDPVFFNVAAARVRVDRAATVVCADAHQLLGAIGFTDEHPLHRYTNRLWAWRDELGTSGTWSVQLGTTVARTNHASAWAALANTCDNEGPSDESEMTTPGQTRQLRG